jgi:hypothetical protein
MGTTQMKHPLPIRVTIVVPVYNDWESFAMLIKGIDKEFRAVLSQTISSVSVLAVDDGSLLPPDSKMMDFHGTCIAGVDILHLAVNVGHQRAIAVALAYLEAQPSPDAVLVMDSDGEDRPEDALRLLKAFMRHPEKIVLASRTKRSEGLAFRLGYSMYRVLYRTLCGSSIRYGNFCVIPAFQLSRLVYISDLWNHFVAGIMRSRLPFIAVPTERGRRFVGRSQMNVVSLIIHGLSAISVHLDTVAVRVLVGTSAMVAIAITGFLAVSLVRLLTDLAIPGWASTVALSFLAIAIQGVLMSILLVFIILNTRQQRTFIPQVDFKHYVKELNRVYERDA